MYDGHIGPGRFHHYRGILSKIYQGEDVDCQLEDITESIQKDYESGSISATQYDNLMSLVQDINDI